jgi:hypothetical protein
MIFNKRLLRGAMVPQDHAELLRLLTEHPQVFQGRIATYDPELSGTGLLFITQDVRITQQTWKLVEAMGRAGVKLYTSSEPMIDRVAAGDFTLAYNIPGSCALERARLDDDLGVVFPGDYTLMMSRIKPSGERMSIFDAATRYQHEGVPLVVFAGVEYGNGSSRDWAAKGTKLIGVRAVIAQSFERIHRSNLVGMGIVPFVFDEGTSWKGLGLTGAETISIRGLAEVAPRQRMSIDIAMADGTLKQVPVTCRIDTLDELNYFKHGGILPYVLRQLAA